MNNQKRIYSLNVQRLDPSKLNYLPVKPKAGVSQPVSVDLSLNSNMPPVYDQGNLGSCTANALCCLMDFDIGSGFKGSRLFLYYNERYIEGTTNQDAGAYLYDGVKALVNWGLCREVLWPYNIAKYSVRPSPQSYSDALTHTLLKCKLAAYNIQNNLITMKVALSSGFMFVVGIVIYESFESDQVTNTGVVPMPGPNENILGGHAVVCVGYNDSKKQWKMRNSWGPSWGDKGYFYLPYEYLTSSQLSSDLWYICKKQ